MKIICLEGPYAGKKYEISSPEVTIGREIGNHLILDTDGVSRFHAALRQQPDGSWLVYDLNSTNGVKIFGTRIQGTAPVAEDTVLTIGENMLKFTGLAPAPEPAPAQVIFNPVISVPGAEGNNSGTQDFFKKSQAAPAPQFETVSAESLELPPAEKAEKPQLSTGEAASGTQSGAAAAVLDLKKFSGSLFGQKKKESADKESAAASGVTDSRKRRSNMIFYTIVGCVVIMILSAAFSIMNPKGKKAQGARQAPPLTVRYEKEVISKGNVFRFDCLLQSGLVKKEKSGKDGQKSFTYEREYTVTFTIDDIASHRHFTRSVPISDETVEELRTVIRSSGIFSNSPSGKGGRDDMNRRLTIVEGGKLLEYSVPGAYASTEFNAVEEAVGNVAKTFGLETISMTPEQLLAQADKNFANAEDLYDNRRAGANNLRDAIKYYRAVTECLEQFSPKPEKWDRARRKLAAAEKERDMLLDALETEYKKLAHLKQFSEMKGVFLQMMDLTDPESRIHAGAKRRLIIVEQMLRKRKK